MKDLNSGALGGICSEWLRMRWEACGGMLYYIVRRWK